MTDHRLMSELYIKRQDCIHIGDEENYNLYVAVIERMRELLNIEWQYKEPSK